MWHKQSPTSITAPTQNYHIFIRMSEKQKYFSHLTFKNHKYPILL